MKKIFERCLLALVIVALGVVYSPTQAEKPFTEHGKELVKETVNSIDKQVADVQTERTDVRQCEQQLFTLYKTERPGVQVAINLSAESANEKSAMLNEEPDHPVTTNLFA